MIANGAASSSTRPAFIVVAILLAQQITSAGLQIVLVVRRLSSAAQRHTNLTIPPDRDELPPLQSRNTTVGRLPPAFGIFRQCSQVAMPESRVTHRVKTMKQAPIVLRLEHLALLLPRLRRCHEFSSNSSTSTLIVFAC